MVNSAILDIPDSRRDALLDAAVSVFARYGFRKTSMDEVARAAGVSRQGLYLLFADKEELFREAVAHKLDRQLGAALGALTAPERSLQQKLLGACEEWCGRYVGVLGAASADIMCASHALAGETLEHYHGLFERALAHAIADSPLARCCDAAGLTPADAARALHATAVGLKHNAKSREDFLAGMNAAVGMFCMPLNAA